MLLFIIRYTVELLIDFIENFYHKTINQVDYRVMKNHRLLIVEKSGVLGSNILIKIQPYNFLL